MKRALVVDDTKNIRNLLTTCLELSDFETKTASNGEEALKLLSNEHFDLVFLDIKMPEISGTEVLRRVRAMGINTPVVIMTAFATVKNAVECTKLGAVAYLQKPFTADKVKSVLEELGSLEEKSKDPADVFISEGKEHTEAGKLDEAYTVLKKALASDPTRGECYYLIGRVMELRNNMEEAQKFYAAAKQFEK